MLQRLGARGFEFVAVAAGNEDFRSRSRDGGLRRSTASQPCERMSQRGPMAPAALTHDAPGHRWTLQKLAECAGMSR